MTTTLPSPAEPAPDLAGALASHGVGSAEMAAIRAFSRVVSPGDYARDFAVCLAQLASESFSATVPEEIEARFCSELVACAAWTEPGPWFERVHAAWQQCLAAGARTGFALDACAALVKASARHLAGDRAVVYQLEMDILFAIDAFAWCVASLLARLPPHILVEQSTQRGERDSLTGLPGPRCCTRLLEAWLTDSAEGRRTGMVVLSMKWGVAVQHRPAADRTPPPTDSGMNTCAATASTTSSMMRRRSLDAVMS